MTPAALAEYHTAQHHPGAPEDCADCAAQGKRQAEAHRALKRQRAHAAARAMDPRRPR